MMIFGEKGKNDSLRPLFKISMTNMELLWQLRKRFRVDGCLSERANLMDLLDDLATIGLEGAGDLYLREVKIWQQETEVVRDINPATGNLSQR